MGAPKQNGRAKAVAVKDPGAFNVQAHQIVMSEATIQRAVCQNLRYRGAENMTWYAVPNGGSRNLIEARKLVEQGLREGVPDIMFTLKGKSYALELKTIKGRLSPAQIKMHIEMAKAGVEVFTAYSLDDALVWLEGVGILKPAAGSKFLHDVL